MKAQPAGDALERLRDDHRQLDELFDTFARRRRGRDFDADSAQRLSEWICTLLRVHDELEESVLDPALARELGAHPMLDRAALGRAGLRRAVDRVEALPPGDPRQGREMARLARNARALFELDEAELFELARKSGLDMQAIDAELSRRQESLLSAGRHVH